MDAVTKIGDFKRLAVEALTPRYGTGESRWIVRLLLEDVMGWSPTDQILRDDYEMTPYTAAKLASMVDRIAGGEPVQYVTGVAQFYGMMFKVTPAVLIPRPETAGLVDLIVDEYGSSRDLEVLDCGTGSGCIAIALARNLPFSRVTAIDIDPAALDVARNNGKALGVDVDWKRQDIMKLADLHDREAYDIIASNPPYIALKEKAEMEAHVVDHEPARALFVPDDDPLVFYKAIADYGMDALKDGGRLYFEINPLYAAELKAYLEREYADVTIERDSEGKLRYAIAKK